MKHEICEKCHFTFEKEDQKCMCIPMNMTCFSCRHFEWCRLLVGTTIDRKNCDWWPIRFSAKEYL